ncbi:MAG: RNase adapter RapZ [Alphaproteobacteria bacterium]|nr:RNase adapter RapZ [Alphaproteobacteria bacterium]
MPANNVPNSGNNAELGEASNRTPVLLVTGISGAGRSTTLKILEDLGYEAVDNLPLTLLPSLVIPALGNRRPLAIGIDVRTRDFGVEQFLNEIDALIARDDLDARMVFLDCDDEVLQRRFTETRRRHPLAADRPVMDGIKHERRLVVPLRDRADLVVDTSQLSLNDLRRLMNGHFALDVEASFAILVMSFSYRNGIPREADLVFDARFLANPHYDEALKPLTGLDARVAKFVSDDPGFPEFFQSLTGLLQPLLPRFQNEGKSYLTIAVGCTGGQHRSVFVAEELVAWLSKNGQHAGVMHRELRDAETRSEKN